MPAVGFSLGRDLTFTVISPNGSTLTLNGKTDYKIKPMFTNLTHKGLNGERINAAIPDGWEITVTMDRKDAIVDKFFAALETQYFAGQNIPGGTISETIQESDGSISQFQYTNVSLTYEDAGSYKSDAYIPITVMARASKRLQLS